MFRSLTVDVRDGTWPISGSLPKFPPEFHKGVQSWDMSVPAMLLMLGYLTTPVVTTGASLSEFWAWVRYFAAISEDADLRLTTSFSTLDAHQKTILSDDFGVGVPMQWLSEKFNLDRILDGAYFAARIGATVGAYPKSSAKRGPKKTPDYVFRDTSGVWHVVECKGTQSGPVYSEKQIGEQGPPATGGIAQKRSITFPPRHTGQRLVSALQIGIESGEVSRLLIVDPVSEKPIVLNEDDMPAAEDGSTRAVAAKALRLAGFEATADVVAAPTGPRADVASYRSREAERDRVYSVGQRDIRARRELSFLRQRTAMFSGLFRGREINVDLPRPLRTKGREFRRIVVQQGVNLHALEELTDRVTIDEFLGVSGVEWSQSLDSIASRGEGVEATLKIGSFFKSHIALMNDSV